MDSAFTVSNGARAGVTKRAIIFLDKPFTGNPADLGVQAKKIEDAGIKIIVIGVGDNFDHKSIKDAFGDIYFFPEDLGYIDRIIKPIVQSTKKGKWP